MKKTVQCSQYSTHIETECFLPNRVNVVPPLKTRIFRAVTLFEDEFPTVLLKIQITDKTTSDDGKLVLFLSVFALPWLRGWK